MNSEEIRREGEIIAIIIITKYKMNRLSKNEIARISNRI